MTQVQFEILRVWSCQIASRSIVSLTTHPSKCSPIALMIALANDHITIFLQYRYSNIISGSYADVIKEVISNLMGNVEKVKVIFDYRNIMSNSK